MALIAIALLAAAPPAAPAPVAPPPPPTVQLPAQLTDPATGDRLADAVEALSHALLNLPVGEVQAAVEGRPPTPADRRRTVGQLDPNFERRIAEARPRIQASMRAMATALPQVMQSLRQAREAVERAAANMPDPNYPKR